jgi:Zn-finger nucleic acid-binding protein
MQLCCLKCTAVLDKTRLGDVEVDYCRECGGLWLDRGELERIVRMTRNAAEVVKVLRRKLIPLPTAAPEPSELSDACPACARSTMREVAIAGLHIDYCTDCEGIFLDKGELDAAMERVKSPGTRMSVLIAVAQQAIPR